jgi:hypothetical protein
LHVTTHFGYSRIEHIDTFDPAIPMTVSDEIVSTSDVIETV